MYTVYLCSLFYPISNTGTCVDQINGYKCQCQPGYTGIDCDVDIDECQSSPCINGKVQVIRVEKSDKWIQMSVSTWLHRNRL